MRQAIAIALLVLMFVSLADSRAEIWGVKTHDPLSGVPATLFVLNDDGSFVAEIGTVTLSGGGAIDADGLAMSPEGDLFIFRTDTTLNESQLMSLNPATAVASAIGPVLTNRQIRGAAFSLSGRLITFDHTASELLEIDPLTGTPLGAPVPAGDLSPGATSWGVDLAQHPDGSFVLSYLNHIARIDIDTGALVPLFQDTVALPDGIFPFLVGLALSPTATSDHEIVALDVNATDDIVRYDPSSGFARSLVAANIVSSYNAGRGDLASLPAGRVEILDFSVTGQTGRIDAVARGGIWAWVEQTPDLLLSNGWNTVGGSVL